MKINKTVGKPKAESPLQRAFRLRTMLIELRGERLKEDNAHIRKLVGRVKSNTNHKLR